MIRLLSSLVFLASFALCLRGLSPGVSLEDTGELIASAFTLGNSHPPGYPWHAMIGRLAAFLPVGCPAFRINLISAFCHAASSLAVWRMVVFLSARLSMNCLIPGLSAAAAFALSRTCWWQATIAEKYSLAVALFAAASFALVRLAGGDRRWLFPAAFLTGLTVSHHLIGLYLLAPLAWLVWRERNGRCC